MQSVSASSPPCAPSKKDLSPAVAEVEFWRRRQASRPWRLLASVVLGLSAVGAASFAVDASSEPQRWQLELARVTEATVPRPWVPGRATDPAVLASIDLRRIHSVLMPAWVDALQDNPITVGREREEQAFSALFDQAAQDRNLADLLTQLRWRSSSLASNSQHIDELVHGWNRYMHANGQPWHLAHHLEVTARGATLHVLSYQVLADAQATVAGTTERVRVLHRLDELPKTTAYLGRTGTDDGALIMASAVAEFALDRVWPMMAPELQTSLPPMERGFAPFVHREATGFLGPQQLTALRRGALLRHEIKAVLESTERRRGCGRTMVFATLPWNGLSSVTLRKLGRMASSNGQRGCGRLTARDVERVRDLSAELSELSGLQGALEQLSGWVARGVAVHEVRHAADATFGLTCEQCPGWLDASDRAEASGYLASMADAGAGYLSLFQACGVELGEPGPSASALAFVLPTLVPEGCSHPPPAGLYASASVLEARLFGRSQAVVLPPDFPQAIPLPSNRMAVTERVRPTALEGAMALWVTAVAPGRSALVEPRSVQPRLSLRISERF